MADAPLKGLLSFPRGDVLSGLLGLPKLRPASPVPETLPVEGPNWWFDADDSATITIATGVSAWANKGSEGGSVSNGTGANQPTWGYATSNADRRALIFDGAGDRLDGSMSNTDQTATYFCAGRMTDAAIVFVGTQGNNGYQHQLSASGLQIIDRFVGGSDWNIGVYPPATNPFVLGYVLRGDGSSPGTYGRLNQQTFGPSVGSYSASQGGSLSVMFDHISGLVTRSGEVYEILKYDGFLTDDQFDLVMQYLGWKWSIEVNA